MFFPQFPSIVPQNSVAQPLGGYLWLATDVVEIFKTPGGERIGYLRAGDFIEEFKMEKHMTQEFVIHREGCSPTTKGLTTVLKPISEYSSPLWKVVEATIARHKPDLNSDADATLSPGIVFEESERGGTYREWIRHSLGWSTSFIVQQESHIASFIPQDHSKRKQNPFVEEPKATQGKLKSVQFLRFRVLSTREGRPPQLSEMHLFFQDRKIIPKSANSNFPTKTPSHYNYASNLLQEDDHKKWYAGEKNSEGLEDIPKIDFQKINITIEFSLHGIYDIKTLSYQLRTATDFPERDPISWEWYGSEDGTIWYLISSFHGKEEEITNQRSSNYTKLSFVSQS